MREIMSTQYIATEYTDDKVLYQGRLIDPVQLNQSLTYLYGKDSDMFPLLTLTEGNGLVNRIPVKMNDTQYTWNVMGRMKYTSPVVALVGGEAKPGLNYQPFQVDFEDNWMIGQYGAFTPDQRHQVRIDGEPVKQANGKFRYTMRLQTSNPLEYIEASNFTGGGFWSMSAPTVAASKSDGNRSNTMTPGKMTNQFGFHRFSQNIAGNIGNKVVNIELDGTDANGNSTKSNMWMPFEMKMWELQRKQLLEEDLWFSKYNRDAYGNVTLKDAETGEDIPRGAGVKEILTTAGNYDTFSTLTLDKLNSVVNRIFDQRIDQTPMELVLYTGIGGAEMFDKAIRNALGTGATGTNSYYEAVGRQEVEDYAGADGLVYGKYYKAYKTIHGHLIVIKVVNLFSNGTLAQQDRANGRIHNGHPYFSYNMVFLDHSKNDGGERNINLVCEEGREYVTGIYKGMSALPGAWGALGENKLLSTKRDIASYEVMSSQGININNPTTSFWLEMV